MKKKLFIRNLVNWTVAILIILTIIISWYLTNTVNPSNVPDKVLEQIQQEEGLK